MEKKYICVVGKKGVGKDTFAEMLEGYLRENGKSCRREALAKPVKALLISMFQCDADLFYDPMKKEEPSDALYGVTPRVAMQKFGTDFSQTTFSPFIWVDHLINRVTTCDEEVIIVTDIRFKHELDRFRDLGAKVIFIERDIPIFDGSKKAFWFNLKRFIKTDTHISEKGLVEFRQPEDATIKNDKGLIALAGFAKAYAECYI